MPRLNIEWSPKSLDAMGLSLPGVEAQVGKYTLSVIPTVEGAWYWCVGVVMEVRIVRDGYKETQAAAEEACEDALPSDGVAALETRNDTQGE